MDINELRSEVKRRQKAARAKVSRLARKGITVAGTEYDPIRPAAPINRYNKRQLESYLNSLNEFTSRRTRFVPLSNNNFVPRQEWAKYAELERRYNRISNREYNKVADLPLPGTGMTVSERDATIRPTNMKIRRASGEAVRRLYEPIKINLENVASPEALRKLINQRQKQISPKYKPEQIARQKKEMRAMMERIGEVDFMAEAEKLTDEQFNILWNYGTFATDLSRDYERVAMLATGGTSAMHDRVHEDARLDVLDALQWAQSLPTSQSRPGRKRKK